MSEDQNYTMNKQTSEFYERLSFFLKETFPEHCESINLDNHNYRIEKYEEFFSFLDEIYEYRSRYDLHWALNEAQERMNNLIEESGEKIREYLAEQLSPDELRQFSTLTAKMTETTREISRKVRRILTYFGTISFLVSLVDIAISVVLIIIISEFAQIGNTLMDSVLLGILFTGFIALFKVTLDRFYIIPKVREWGWKKYLKEVQITKQTLVETNAIAIIVVESIRRKEEPDVTYGLFEAGINRMSKI